MAKVDIKYLVDLYRRAKSHDDVYVLSHAESAIEAAKEMESAVHKLTLAEAIVEEAIRE